MDNVPDHLLPLQLILFVSGAFTMFPLILRDQLRIAHFATCVLFISIWGIFLLIRGDTEQSPTVLLSSTTPIDQKKECMDAGGTLDTPVTTTLLSSGKERMFHKIFHSHEYLQQQNIDELHCGNPITY